VPLSPVAQTWFASAHHTPARGFPCGSGRSQFHRNQLVGDAAVPEAGGSEMINTATSTPAANNLKQGCLISFLDMTPTPRVLNCRYIEHVSYSRRTCLSLPVSQTGMAVFGKGSVEQEAIPMRSIMSFIVSKLRWC